MDFLNKQLIHEVLQSSPLSNHNDFLRLTDCRRHVATQWAVKNAKSKLVNGGGANIIRLLRTVRITLHAVA